MLWFKFESQWLKPRGRQRGQFSKWSNCVYENDCWKKMIWKTFVWTFLLIVKLSARGFVQYSVSLLYTKTTIARQRNRRAKVLWYSLTFAQPCETCLIQYTVYNNSTQFTSCNKLNNVDKIYSISTIMCYVFACLSSYFFDYNI